MTHDILIAVLRQQRNEALDALAQAIAQGEVLTRELAELKAAQDADAQ